MLNTMPMNGRFAPDMYVLCCQHRYKGLHSYHDSIYDLLQQVSITDLKVLMGSNLAAVYALNGKGRLRESTHSDIMIMVMFNKSCPVV